MIIKRIVVTDEGIQIWIDQRMKSFWSQFVSTYIENFQVFKYTDSFYCMFSQPFVVEINDQTFQVFEVSQIFNKLFLFDTPTAS